MSEAVPEQPVEGAEEQAQEAWTGPSQEEWGQLQEFMGAFNEYLTSPQPQAQQPGVEQAQQMGLDPFADNFQEQLDSYIQQQLQPVQQFTNQAQYAEAEQRAQDILSDLQAQNGEFINPERTGRIARSLADEYVAEFTERYGNGPKAAEAALQKAYETAKAYEEELGKQYHERQMNQLSTLSNAQREPGVTGASVQQVDMPKGDEMALVRSRFGMTSG